MIVNTDHKRRGHRLGGVILAGAEVAMDFESARTRLRRLEEHLGRLIERNPEREVTRLALP